MTAYETQVDLDNEERFAEQMREQGWDMQKLSGFYPFDYFGQRGAERVFIEYKRRNHNFGTYPTAYFPAQKFARCRLWARELNTPFSIFLEYDDQIRHCNGMQIGYTVSLAGRNDRGECGIEPMVELDLSQFYTCSWRHIRGT